MLIAAISNSSIRFPFVVELVGRLYSRPLCITRLFFSSISNNNIRFQLWIEKFDLGQYVFLRFSGGKKRKRASGNQMQNFPPLWDFLLEWEKQKNASVEFAQRIELMYFADKATMLTSSWRCRGRTRNRRTRSTWRTRSSATRGSSRSRRPETTTRVRATPTGPAQTQQVALTSRVVVRRPTGTKRCYRAAEPWGALGCAPYEGGHRTHSAIRPYGVAASSPLHPSCNIPRSYFPCDSIQKNPWPRRPNSIPRLMGNSNRCWIANRRSRRWSLPAICNFTHWHWIRTCLCFSDRGAVGTTDIRCGQPVSSEQSPERRNTGRNTGAAAATRCGSQ